MKTFLPLLIFFSFSIQAQQDTWEHYYTGDYINDVLETTNHLWVGTTVGLLKVDKTTDQFELLSVFNSDLKNDNVRSIIQDQNGIIWIKTNLGVSKFEAGDWVHFTPDNSILEPDDPRESYYSQTDQLYVDGENRVWTKNNDRLLYYKDGNWTFTYEASTIVHFRVNPGGNAWLLYFSTSGVPEKLKRFDGENWIIEDANLPPTVNSFFMSMITFDNDNNFWFTVNTSPFIANGGLLKWDFANKFWDFYPRDSTIQNSLRGLTVDSDNNVWTFNVFENEFVKFTPPNTWEKIQLPDSLQYNLPHEVVSTENGIAFLLTDDWGNKVRYLGFLDTLNQLEIIPTPFTSKTRKNKLTHLSDGSIFMGGVRANPTVYKNGVFQSYNIGNADIDTDALYQILGEDNTGKKYFNMALRYYSFPLFNKISTFDNQNWETINFPVDYPISTDVHTRLNPNGEIWIGENDGDFTDIHLYKNGAWQLLNIEAESFFNQPIQYMELDQEGSLWIATEETHSIFKYENNLWKEYDFAELGMPDFSYQIWGFDNENQIWIDIRYGYQPFKLNNSVDTFEMTLDPQDMYPVFQFPSYGDIKIKEQDNGNIFFMREQRLIRYDGTDLIYYDESNSPLPNGVILNNIQLDSSDYIWLATDQGVYKFDGDSTWVNFTPYNSPLADIIVDDIFVDRDNKIWMLNYQSGIYVLNEGQPTNTSEVINEANFSATVFPNPFSNNITITYDLKNPSKIDIEILDLTGRVIKNIQEGKKIAGKHQSTIQLPQLPQGIYFCKITTKNSRQILKLIKS